MLHGAGFTAPRFDDLSAAQALGYLAAANKSDSQGAFCCCGLDQPKTTLFTYRGKIVFLQIQEINEKQEFIRFRYKFMEDGPTIDEDF